ncbi:hypothetical protein [Crocosphaera watsonii]|uniref:Uncharacterized protein n=3 Tax=Crocosphaera watsonii TaxID=263511 RepID=T2JTQ7_CROWT|nr:hypothetical protein [Crocosphaera watsonii]EHJ09610.1 hypothetical protein CWATWH0003_5617 [Crocosphaera watsonii WH 0003]CCQ55676.1 DNA primase [Crocosphaera watsonii WH 0005]CCQ69223.1 hypothetical protein CWATWH0402_2491 [Crocosphaera watsonii WH 0402]
MKNINKEHRNEWVIGSGVHPEIVGLNVRSLIGSDTYDFLLYSDNVPRKLKIREIGDNFIHTFNVVKIQMLGKRGQVEKKA